MHRHFVLVVSHCSIVSFRSHMRTIALTTLHSKIRQRLHKNLQRQIVAFYIESAIAATPVIYSAPFMSDKLHFTHSNRK